MDDTTKAFVREAAGYSPGIRATTFPDENPHPVLAADSHGRVVYHNAAAAELVHEVGAKRLEALLPSRHTALVRESLERGVTLNRVVDAGNRSLNWCYRPVSASRVVHLYGLDITDNRRLEGALRHSREVSRRLAKRLSRQDWYDPLTGLPNRRALERRLGTLVRQARDRGSVHALAHFDIDQFKLVNTTCGHGAGDALLRELAARLRQCLRPRDMLAYAGEDEFTLLCEGCREDSALVRVAALRAAIHDLHFTWNGKTPPVTASVGVVPFGPEAESVGMLLDLADAACSLAKGTGRDHVHVYSPDDAELAQRRRQMLHAAAIESALDEGRFRLERHAIVPVAAGDTSRQGFELLLRMEDPAGTTIMPEVFLPAAERFNLAVRLDRWVVETAVGWLASQPRAALPAFCCINLSGQSLSDAAFMRFVARQVAQCTAAPGRVCFEITETAAIENMGAAVEFIEAVRSHGCRFALDDFGTGMSSFAYLRNLPVDFLKIDGAFVRGIGDDPVDLAMVKSINEIGHVMGKRTIAEYVENDAVLQKLRELEIDYAQGDIIAHPVPIAA